MTYGRSKLYGDRQVAEKGDVSAAAVLEPGPDAEIYREIDTLKSINAQLIRQIEALRESEAQAHQLADRDGLTGLYNRRRMLELLERSLDAARRRGGKVGLLFVDLDGFKGVNDLHGHAVGDRLLMTVAARISGRARAADFVCRYGGDEFVVILPSITGPSDVEHVAASIRERVCLPCRCDGVELAVSASVGEAIFPDEGTTAEFLLEAADRSMYREKAQLSESNESLRRRKAPARRHDDAEDRDG